MLLSPSDAVRADEKEYQLDIRISQNDGVVTFGWDPVPRAQWPPAGPGGEWSDVYYTVWAWKMGETWPYEAHFCDGTVRSSQVPGWPSQSGTDCTISTFERGVDYNFAVTAVAFTEGLQKAQILYADIFDEGGVTVCCGTPSAPRDVRLVAMERRTAMVEWMPPESSGGADRVQFDVVLSPGDKRCVTQDFSCEFAGLDFGTEYVASVRSVTVGGRSEASASSPLFLKSPDPNSPRRVRASLRGTDIVVSWRPPRGNSENIRYRYRVFADPGKGKCVTRRERCRITGLKLGRTYSFQVVAIDSRGGRSPAMASNSVSIPDPPRDTARPGNPAPEAPAKPDVPFN